MTTKTKIIIGVGSAVALIASYLIYKKMSSDKGEKNPPKKGEENPPKKDDTNECKKYIVSVSKGNLNKREQPNDKSKIIGSIPKAKEIYAKKSNTDGWMELCEDGGGFVSLKYLKEVN